MTISMITIIYGCSRAVKETHIKRRLAWSTVSNLSYILFGATIMTPLGLVGALAHFVFHGFMKICLITKPYTQAQTTVTKDFHTYILTEIQTTVQ